MGKPSIGGPPKLKVEGLGWEKPSGCYDFEQAKYFPFSRNVLVIVEGQVIRSYADLLRLMEQPDHNSRESLDVKFLAVVAGG